MKNEIKLTNEFKSKTTKAVLSIVLFIAVYFLLFLLVMGLTAVCVYFGIGLIIAVPKLITILLGIGLASLGILILGFLIKFMFKSNKIDRSHLYEISRSDEPELYKMIDEIVEKVGTTRPKKVYLSNDVNAAVFYDSSFWSMFLPVKKNLQIGLGLVNSVTKEELKAILSHEFGHFSQRTMKVGSYVYNVNKVIFNMLYDNESYYNAIQQWSNISGYFSIFVVITIKITQGIQWILKQIYQVVNKSYLGLSREMEFHADEIAAHVTGYLPLKTSLLRMSIADSSFDSVLNFYTGKIDANIKSENIYADQYALMHFLAEYNSFPLKNGFPEVSMEEQSKFNKSKLVIKDQWASHPSIEDRIKRLEATKLVLEIADEVPANVLFKDIHATQKRLTKKIFEPVKYKGETSFLPIDKFTQEYKESVLDNTFSKVYNGYYDHKTPSVFDLDKYVPLESDTELSTLFSDKNVDLVYTAVALKNDMESIKSIAQGNYQIKTFDYDGIKYNMKDASDLSKRLEKKLENLNKQINDLDILIYDHFLKLEAKQSKTPPALRNIYSNFFDVEKSFDSKLDLVVKLTIATHFISEITQIDQIKSNLADVKQIEYKLKKQIKDLLNDQTYQELITKDIKDNFEKYLAEDLNYFYHDKYDDENLNILSKAVDNYSYLLTKNQFEQKKKLLRYQEELFSK
ncbi:MAG: M48 family metalloprotease [Bacteroidia bacterium]|nr:M48 family metalloprotease [Bacteroidia bacterium]